MSRWNVRISRISWEFKAIKQQRRANKTRTHPRASRIEGGSESWTSGSPEIPTEYFEATFDVCARARVLSSQIGKWESVKFLTYIKVL